MYGIQLSDTDGFTVRNCSFSNNPNPSKAGLRLQSSKNGVVEGCRFHNNWNSLVVAGARNVSISGLVGCARSFEHGLCGKPSPDITKGFKIRDSDCGVPEAECAFREAPFKTDDGALLPSPEKTSLVLQWQ